MGCARTGWRKLRRRVAVVGVAVVTMVTAAYTRDAKADAVTLWNTEMLSLIRQTSGLLVSGPPEVAREIAILTTSMFDAVNAASGSPLTPYAYTGGPVAGASAEAAALSAGYTALTSIFSNPIWATPGGGNATLINTVILPQSLSGIIPCCDKVF